MKQLLKLKNDETVASLTQQRATYGLQSLPAVSGK